MVGRYDASTGSLVLRQPPKLFMPLAWLLAGPLNPAGFFAHLPWNERAWDMPFDPVMWATSVALPLSVGCAIALAYLRGGGFGFMTLFLILGLSTLAACAVTGPIYASVILILREFGIYWTIFPVFTFEQALITSGTFIRLGLILVSLPLVAATVVLRVVAFRREPRAQTAKAAASNLGF
jgi:hypothetical protein